MKAIEQNYYKLIKNPGRNRALALLELWEVI
jgi:hypothetical protein